MTHIQQSKWCFTDAHFKKTKSRSHPGFCCPLFNGRPQNYPKMNGEIIPRMLTSNDIYQPPLLLAHESRISICPSSASESPNSSSSQSELCAAKNLVFPLGSRRAMSSDDPPPSRKWREKWVNIEVLVVTITGDLGSFWKTDHTNDIYLLVNKLQNPPKS